MTEKVIRSHAARVKQANTMLENHPDYRYETISIYDREAFVELFLLEDIVRLYEMRLKREESHIPNGGRTDEKGKQLNIKRFSAIIELFKAAIGAARAAISGGDYKKVWKAIPEWPLKMVAGNVKNLPQLRKMTVEMLRELSSDAQAAETEMNRLDEDLDDLEEHEENVRLIKNIPMSKEDIEKVIRLAEEVIPDPQNSRNSRPNI